MDTGSEVNLYTEGGGRLKVTLHLITEDKEEHAELYLHERNRRKEEIKAYLENDGLSNPVLTVTKEGRNVYLSGQEILFVEADKNKRLVCTQEGTFHSQLKLYELEHMLPTCFVRISKSVILNTDKVRVYRPLANGLMAAELAGGQVVYISRMYLKELLQRIRKI